MFWCLERAVQPPSIHMALKYVVSWTTIAEVPGLPLLSECKLLFVSLSHTFGSSVHAGLFLSGLLDWIVRMDEPNFYCCWQEDHRAAASADRVGQDSNEVRDWSLCPWEHGDLGQLCHGWKVRPNIECVRMQWVTGVTGSFIHHWMTYVYWGHRISLRLGHADLFYTIISSTQNNKS